jgi:iron complex transport system substrate-binding protein
MRARFRAVVLLVVCLIAITPAGCDQTAATSTFTDDMGRQIDIDYIPQRIVSHVPSITEMLFALGLDDRLVGVSDYCDFPEAAKNKPKVGDYFNPSVEQIVALDPDLVLTDGHSESIMPLTDLGITLVVIDPKDIDTIMQDFELLGKLTGRQKEASAITSDMERRLTDISRRVQDTTKVMVFYTFAVTDLNNPWSAGPGSFVDALITLAGGQNVVSGTEAWIQVSVEQVLGGNPELIIVDTSMGSAVESLETLRTQMNSHPAWKETTAVKHDNIFAIDGNLLNRPGPRIIEGLEEMARIIHPEIFDS